MLTIIPYISLVIISEEIKPSPTVPLAVPRSWEPMFPNPEDGTLMTCARAAAQQKFTMTRKINRRATRTGMGALQRGRFSGGVGIVQRQKFIPIRARRRGLLLATTRPAFSKMK